MAGTRTRVEEKDDELWVYFIRKSAWQQVKAPRTYHRKICCARDEGAVFAKRCSCLLHYRLGFAIDYNCKQQTFAEKLCRRWGWRSLLLDFWTGQDEGQYSPFL